MEASILYYGFAILYFTLQNHKKGTVNSGKMVKYIRKCGASK
jgi:hypothetical protein